MSVYLSDRGENKFDVLIKARELAVYTIQITHNKNVFSDYDTIVNDLQKLGKGNCYNLKQRLIKWYEVTWYEICKN